jgi:acyl-phosphate glycerol 3-phosphate acyltransferase
MMILYAMFGFLCGSLMFSWWIGLALKHDIRQVGDGNPGAANLWKAAGSAYGLLGVALDFAKGFVPVWLCLNDGSLAEYEWVPVALSPILGHAFSPFLKFQGGKGVAVTFGVWSALTGFQASLAYAVILAVLWVAIRIWKKGEGTTSAEDGMHTTLGFLLLSGFLLYMPYPLYVYVVWLANLLVMLWKNRLEWLTLLKAKEEPEEENVRT